MLIRIRIYTKYWSNMTLDTRMHYPIVDFVFLVFFGRYRVMEKMILTKEDIEQTLSLLEAKLRVSSDLIDKDV